MLDTNTRAMVRGSAPALHAHGIAVVERMYELLFRDRAIEAVFDPTHMRDGTQPRALAEAVAAYADHIDDLEALLPAVERIAHKHVALGITPEHYGAVGACLIEAMADVLREAASPDLLGAWTSAFSVLADVFIRREHELALAAAATPGGWQGLRPFRVTDVQDESAVIRSVTLVPSDGRPVSPHRPGQYLTLHLPVSAERPLFRHYSLSGAPNDRAYRISVKREPMGTGSGFLHGVQIGSVLPCAPPAGHFVLDTPPERPVVLLSGGVGQTPMLSMLHALSSADRAPVHYLHAAIDGGVHAFRAEVGALAARAPWVRSCIFYERPRDSDRLGFDYDQVGRIDDDALACAAGADVYLCGPTAFMRAMLAALDRLGVPAERIRFEFFGPQSSLEGRA